MGECRKAMAQRGAVGATARWAADLYHRWARLMPEDNLQLDSVFAVLIATRYDLEALAFPGGRAARIRSALEMLRDAGRIRSLCHAVVLLLVAEGDIACDIADNQPWAKEVFVEVIGLELALACVPERYAFGEDLHLCPRRRCSVYQPTVQMLRLLL